MIEDSSVDEKPCAILTGKERDPESGLDYFGARYYWSSAGRFSSPDIPLLDQTPSDPQSWNLYSYVRNNPLRYTDPTGHCLYPGGDCAQYIIGGLKAVGNIPSDVFNAPNRLTNALISPFTEFRFQDLVPQTFAPTNSDQQKGIQAAEITMLLSPLFELAAAEAPAVATPTILENAAAGKAFQEAVATQTALTDGNVVQNLTLKTQSGIRTVMDVVSTKPSGNIALTEAKGSATAPLTRNQVLGHPEIARTGATVVGKGKPGYPGGTVIPPTRVQVIRPEDLKKCH